MADGRGLPLLSGPPPPNENGRAEIACRKCNKEFNIIFTRSRRCNHCGYAYCHNCTDFQALMPRTATDASAGSGYDLMNVCAFCIEFLQITAAGKGHLKGLPLAKLRKYAAAYNIKIDHAVEKDDIIEALVSARGPNGCLPPRNENYYRTHSVPDRTSGTRPRGFFSRTPAPAPTTPPPPPPQSSRPEFARPDLAPDNPPPPSFNNNSRPQPSRTQPSTPRPTPRPQPQPSYQQYPYQQYHPPPNHHHPYSSYYHGTPPQPPRYSRPQGAPAAGPYQHPGPSRSSHNLNTPPPRTPPRPRAASATPRTPAPTPPPPTPTLEELLSMPPENVSSMSISTLKAILFNNHVNAGMILEKGELVKKVNDLIEDEKRERERMRMAEEREDLERIRRQREMMEERERVMREKEEEERRRREEAEGMETETSTPATPPLDSSEDTTVNEESTTSGGTAGASESTTDQPPSTSVPPPSSPPPPPSSSSPPRKTNVPPPSTTHTERSGLCVVCQDEEANIAIVDCGHLAMCRTCCDAIMHSTRECPLCRTRIVTEARLLRIFKP